MVGLSLCIIAAAATATPDDDEDASKLLQCMCMDGLTQFPDSSTTSRVHNLLFHCVDAMTGYATHHDLSLIKEVSSFVTAALSQLKYKMFKKYKFLKTFLMDSLRKDSQKKLAEDLFGILKQGYQLHLIMTQGTRLIDKITMRIASKFFKPAIKGAIDGAKYGNYVGIAADTAEFLLEEMGYKSEAKVVGRVGNMASGAMIGFSMGGPLGAAIGAGVMLLMKW